MQCSNGISMINSIQMVALTSTNHLYANLMNLPFVHFLIRLPYHFACVLPTIVLQVGVTTKSMYAVVVLVLEFGSMGVSVLVCVQLLLAGTRQRCEHRS